MPCIVCLSGSRIMKQAVPASRLKTCLVSEPRLMGRRLPLAEFPLTLARTLIGG